MTEREFGGKMLQIRGGKKRAEEARKIANRQIKLTADDVYATIRDLSVRGCYSAIFDQRQMTEEMKKELEMQGYRLIAEKYILTIAWNR